FGRDTALGSDSADVLGGLVGTEVGEAYGVGGLGLVGTGRGGGGTGEGTIGLGNLGTIGKGGGGGSGSGYGRGAGGAGRRGARGARLGAGSGAGHRGSARLARQGDHPSHHPPPHQRSAVLLRARAGQAGRAGRPRHDPVHDLRNRQRGGLHGAVLHHEQPAGG